jgi:hypothetical protein
VSERGLIVRATPQASKDPAAVPHPHR